MAERRILEAAGPLVDAVLQGQVTVEQAAEKFDIPVWEAWAAVLEAGVRRNPKTGDWYVESREAHPEATVRRIALKSPRPFPRQTKVAFTGDSLKAAAEEYRGGASLKALAVKYGASPTTVRKYLLQAGVEVREPGRRSTAGRTSAPKTASA